MAGRSAPPPSARREAERHEKRPKAGQEEVGVPVRCGPVLIKERGGYQGEERRDPHTQRTFTERAERGVGYCRHSPMAPPLLRGVS